MNIIIDPEGVQFKYKKLDFKWWRRWFVKYKYEVLQDYRVKLHFKPKKRIESEFYIFDIDGWLTIKKGYRWDGASGPTWDTKSVMRASAVHDVIYQMIRRGEIEVSFKDSGDRELQLIMVEDYHPSNSFTETWSNFRAGYYYQAVKFVGGSSCEPGSEKAA